MAKKRKAKGGDSERTRDLGPNVGDSHKRIRTYQDVADSDDEFHLNRGEIRLGEEPEAKRRRQWNEQEQFLQPSDEEVLGDSEDEDEDDGDGDDGFEEKRPFNSRYGIGSRLHGSEDGDAMGKDGEPYEDDYTGWGTSKADLYGADTIETEEQALEEEAEALRLQKKHLQSLNAADYGFGDNDWQAGDNENIWNVETQGDIVTEVLPELTIPADMGLSDRLKLLKSRYPEFEPLSKEMLQLKESHALLTQRASSSPVASVKLRAASAYLGSLTMYFCLLTSTASNGDGDAVPMSAQYLRDHSIMENLIKCRQLWQNVSELSEEAFPRDSNATLVTQREESLSDQDPQETLPGSQVPEMRAERSKRPAPSEEDTRKTERMRRMAENLADIDTLLLPNPRSKSTNNRSTTSVFKNSYDSDLGEDAPALTERETAEKASRRKSLRFYASQIAQKANKRDAAGRNVGGDDDIPYRERLKDRQARLNAEAEKRGKPNAKLGATLGAESDGDDDGDDRAEVEANEYYNLIAARTAKKRNDKTALAELQKQAALQGGRVVQEETTGPDGKRKISYAIEKNKGLTPRRKKDVRNPRVKKRKKFDEKKKKLASMKPVYKGGEGRGGYGGELTGIKKGLVKSTKL